MQALEDLRDLKPPHMVQLFAAPDCCEGPFAITFGGPSFEYPASFGADMSTAIVSTYVNGSGFTLAADGLRQDQVTGKPRGLNVQKIFFIETQSAGLAYAWTGATQMFDADGKQLFDLLDASLESVALIRDYPEADFYNLVKKFTGYSYRKLALVETNQYPQVTAADPGMIARVLIVGYFGNTPCRAEVEIRHSDNTLCPPMVTALHIGSIPRDFRVFSGSAAMLERFKPQLVEPRSLEDGADLARRYIQLCIDNSEADEESKKIGGHIHIATVTVQGVQWRIPPAKPETK